MTSNSTQDCRFYTYAWLRENGTPFYIGKGCGHRAWVKHKNWSPPPKERILILKKNLTENQALDHEKYMIFVLGRKFEGGILHNSSEGGETGPTNPSPETREKMGIWQRGIPKPSSSVEKMRSSLRSLPKPRWYNKNGKNIFIRDGSPPDGFVPGRSVEKDWGPRDRNKRVWWNNGNEEVWREVCPGKGWTRGRKKGQKRNRRK